MTAITTCRTGFGTAFIKWATYRSLIINNYIFSMVASPCVISQFQGPRTAIQVTVSTNHGSRTYRIKLFIHPCVTLRLWPLPYWCPTPSVTQPPIASMTSAGHSTSLSRSLKLCRNEWITQPCGTLGFSHLFNAALAELALHLASLQYLGKANSPH